MKKFKVGLQLFSVRDAMAQDFEGTLQKVKDMGYDYVEFAGYFDHTAEEVKAILDKTGLTAISVHQTYDLFLKDENAVKFLETIGAKYSAMPWMGIEKQKGTELYEKTIEELTEVSKMLKESGIDLLYHNHEFEFGTFEGRYLLDWLCEDMEGYMMPELDTCWVHYAGLKPDDYMRKYKDKLPVLHLKDFVCKKLGSGPVYTLIDENGNEGKKASREDNGFEFRPLGQGIQNFAEILAAAEECGTEYVIVEQDGFTDIEPLEAVKQSREYLKETFDI